MPADFDSWVQTLATDVSSHALPLLREVFNAHGTVEIAEVNRFGRARQLALAEEAVRLVARDIAATTELGAPPFEYRDDDDGVRIAFRGQFAPSPMLGMTQLDVMVEVAGFFQDEVVEDLHRPWPECRVHQSGLHVSRSSDRAEWLCRSGPHVVARFGDLTG